MRFDKFHPGINLIYFMTAVFCSLYFEHPIYVGINCVCAVLYSEKLVGKKIIRFQFFLLFLSFFYTIIYISYEHFGVTILAVNIIGNKITLEALVYGMIKDGKILSFCCWLCCIFTLITSDKIIYLMGRFSPQISLYLSIIFRTIPKIKEHAVCIMTDREGIGKGRKHGKIAERVQNIIFMFSGLILWTMEDFMESTISMKNRGYSLKGRTSFSIYRFDNRDRSIIVVFCICITIIGISVPLGQTRMYFDPVLSMNPITAVSYLFYMNYIFFLLLPFGMQILEEKKGTFL